MNNQKVEFGTGELKYCPCSNSYIMVFWVRPVDVLLFRVLERYLSSNNIKEKSDHQLSAILWLNVPTVVVVFSKFNLMEFSFICQQSVSQELFASFSCQQTAPLWLSAVVVSNLYHRICIFQEKKLLMFVWINILMIYFYQNSEEILNIFY